MSAPGRAAAANEQVVAEFASADAMSAAVSALRAAQYDDLCTYAPFDMPELDEALGLKRSRIGWVVLAGGIMGLVASYAIQWYANVRAYPLVVGGRPVHAVPAFLLATFEGTVLGAALAAFVGLLLSLRLPKLWAPIDEIDGFERASIDRFWIVLGTLANDADRARAERLLRDAGAVRTVRATGV